MKGEKIRAKIEIRTKKSERERMGNKEKNIMGGN